MFTHFKGVMRQQRFHFYHWFFRLILATALAIGMGYLPYKAYGPNGIPRALRLERDLQGLVESNTKLLEENQGFRKAIKSLNEDRTAIERVARDELGLVREEEIIFQFE